jgi:cytochrome P450
VPDTVKSIPGLWGPLLTFINGTHACIGYRFSLIETKIILHALLCEFNFALAFEPSDLVKKHTGIVMRPHLKSQKEKGAQLPLLVERVSYE